MTTVKDVISQCNTGLVRGLSLQIIAEMNHLAPNILVSIADLRVTATNPKAVNLFMQPAAKEALRDALEDRPGHTLPINSAYRTIAQQYLLFRQFKMGRCGITAAARPGRSNHEDGLALDTGEHAAWKSVLEANGWDWLGPGDRVHFDFKGGGVRHDLSDICIRAFQTLWNRHNPQDPIGVDGGYGPQTEARLAQSPAAGFRTARNLRLADPPLQGPDVTALQQALTHAGFATAATGSFDAATDAQVRAFQTAQDLVVDGIVGAGTRRALGLPL